MRTQVWALLVVGLSLETAGGAITTVTEVNLEGDAAAIIESGSFGEDALVFSDRTHEHNGAAFDVGTGLLSTTGANVISLPSYLIGNDYVRFANDARDNAGYAATVTTDIDSIFYLLIDNRVDGPAASATSSNTTDPVLGGTLQWVIDGGWSRVDTGISPNGQADYTGVDEGGDGIGPGLGLNQFYSVWSLPNAATSVTISNNGTAGSNMVSIVAVPVPEPSHLGLLMTFGSIGLWRRRR